MGNVSGEADLSPERRRRSGLNPSFDDEQSSAGFGHSLIETVQP
jgi:hypothetical protein